MQGNPSRQLWIAAIVVSIVCVVGLAYALVTDWNTEPDKALGAPSTGGGGGFGIGLLIGIGAGVVIGSLIAVRRR